MSGSGQSPRPTGRRPKAADVAAEANVSIATVSLVINGKAGGRVAPATQERVRRAIDRLGYVVDSAARSLVTGRSHCVALVAPDVANPFYSQVAAGVASALGGAYRLLLAVAGPDRDLPDLDELVAFGVDGILIGLPGVTVDPGELGRPVVLLDEPVGPSELSRVYFDTGPSVRALVDRLVALGHRRLAYLDATRDAQTFASRRRQVLDRLRDTQGTSVTRARADLTVDAASAVVAERWPAWRADGVTAIIAATDVLAYGALAAFAVLDVAVPDQVSLGSFDDLPFSAITSPPLTTIRLSAYDLGHTSATVLRELMADAHRAPTKTALATTLVERRSLGPVLATRKLNA
ncbi:LacI family DNA-binding transcriptional regulator [Pseudonocardia acaciae]|uniref:LacI family DNA-binding transcriptional regulator n=1 Tax=Pseudonocardia acaciae TaxID=551276 RepID=UPI0007E8BA86|nr:LacI family DNA-binding transcriptional regulator [Pseudonocardia acaciae]